MIVLWILMFVESLKGFGSLEVNPVVSKSSMAVHDENYKTFNIDSIAEFILITDNSCLKCLSDEPSKLFQLAVTCDRGSRLKNKMIRVSWEKKFGIRVVFTSKPCIVFSDLSEFCFDSGIGPLVVVLE